MAGKKSKKARNTGKYKTFPADLCAPGAVGNGFGLLEPVANYSSTLLTAADNTLSAKTLAADSLCHLVEGWRYLAGAIYAFLSDASGVAIHQAYYAELRAVFSLFSASGIRIKYPAHQYLNSAGNSSTPIWNRVHTHTLAWALWRDWLTQPFADTLFCDEQKIHPSVTVRALQQNLQNLSPTATLHAWGFDLISLKKDHEARNISSYDPYWGMTPLSSMSDDDFSFVKELWQQLQPASTGLQFEISLVHFLIDTELAQHRQVAGFNEDNWYTTLASTLSSNTGAPVEELLPLLRQRPFSIRPFMLASDPQTAPRNVISRALFLLRFASLGAQQSFNLFSLSSGKRWLRYWLAHAGLWNDVVVSLPADVWSDFQDLLDAGPPGAPLPYKIFHDEKYAEIFARLGRPDAAIAWSLRP